MGNRWVSISLRRETALSNRVFSTVRQQVQLAPTGLNGGDFNKAVVWGDDANLASDRGWICRSDLGEAELWGNPGPGHVSLWKASGPGTPPATPCDLRGSWAAAAEHGHNQTSWPAGSEAERNRPVWSGDWAVPEVGGKIQQYNNNNNSDNNNGAKPSVSCLWALGHHGDATLVSPGALPALWQPVQGSRYRNRWVGGVQGTSCSLQTLMGLWPLTLDRWTHADQPWTE